MIEQLAALSKRLARLATHNDITGQWPQSSLDALTEAGAWTWIIPTALGGQKLEPVSQLLAYEAIAAGCMATALILTQRDAACELIAACSNESLRNEYLPRLARHEIMTSVGISQLTTSRQGGRPALAAEPQGDDFRLKGVMPWVTSAAHCDVFVAGAVLPDGRELLGLVPADLAGVQIDAPMDLMALQASHTAEVNCRNVILPRSLVLRGPQERVLASRSPIKSLVVATCGVGLAGAMLEVIRESVGREGDSLTEGAEEIEARYEAVRERLFRFAETADRPDEEDHRSQIRIAVNDLLARLAPAILVFAKGSSLLRQRDAQRLSREALFFMVWSAPREIRQGTLAALFDAPIDRLSARSVSTD